MWVWVTLGGVWVGIIWGRVWEIWEGVWVWVGVGVGVGNMRRGVGQE